MAAGSASSVQISIAGDGRVEGRVLQAFDAPGRARLAFGEPCHTDGGSRVS